MRRPLRSQTSTAKTEVSSQKSDFVDEDVTPKKVPTGKTK